MIDRDEERCTFGTIVACFSALLFALEAAFLFYAYHDVGAGRLLCDTGRSLGGRLEYLVHTRFMNEDFNTLILLVKAAIMLVSTLLLGVGCFYAHPGVYYALGVVMVAVIISSLFYPLSIPLAGVNASLAGILAVSSLYLDSTRLTYLRPFTLRPLKNIQPRRGPEPFLYGPSLIPL